MPILYAMFFGLVGGAIVFLVGALMASVAAAALHMSNMEGAAGISPSRSVGWSPPAA